MAIQYARQSGGRIPPEVDGWQRHRDENVSDDRLARGLGWFSVALGLAEIAAPRSVARAVGAPSRPVLIRLLGLRELASGVGILSQRRPTGWLWSRVGGDVMDLALLSAAFTSRKAEPGRLSLATAAVVGVTALDVVASERITRVASERGIRVVKSIAVGRSPEELYRFWHDFQNLPRFMKHVESVRVIDSKRSNWVAKAPGGHTVEWDAEIVDDRPNQLIAWRSLPGAEVDNSGSVRFVPAPGGRGTFVTVEMEYDPPGGVIGSLVAKLFGEEPAQQVAEDLRRFKQLIETGEIPTTEGQPTARGSRGLWSRRPS